MPQAPDCSACGHPESSHTQGWGCHVYSCDCGDYRMAPTDADTEAERDTERIDWTSEVVKAIEAAFRHGYGVGHEDANAYGRWQPKTAVQEYVESEPMSLRRLRQSDPGGERDGILDEVAHLCAIYGRKWVTRPDSYWFQRLLQEVGELGSSLAGDHDDPPEHELLQIASIAVNWLRKRSHDPAAPTDEAPEGERDGIPGEKADVLEAIADSEKLTWADRHALRAIASGLRTAPSRGQSVRSPY